MNVLHTKGSNEINFYTKADTIILALNVHNNVNIKTKVFMCELNIYEMCHFTVFALDIKSLTFPLSAFDL